MPIYLDRTVIFPNNEYEGVPQQLLELVVAVSHHPQQWALPATPRHSLVTAMNPSASCSAPAELRERKITIISE